MSLNYIIAINTYKRETDLVKRSLQNSLAQKIKPIKVILIDQNPVELELPIEITKNKLFERQRVSSTGVSAARNKLQIPLAANWIFFCDDDGYPDLNYSEQLNKIIEANPEVEILAGKIIREDLKTAYSLRQKNPGSLKKFYNTKKLMGSNLVIKTTVFDELNRFDENFGAGSYWGSGEETDFCWKAFFAGKQIEFCPELKVFHVPPFQESLKYGFKKSFNYAVGKGALANKWIFKKKKISVLYEIFEMILIPFLHMGRGLVTLKLQLIVNNIATLTGRIYGFLKAFFVLKY